MALYRPELLTSGSQLCDSFIIKSYQAIRGIGCIMLGSTQIGTGSRVSECLILIASHVLEVIKRKHTATIRFRDYDESDAVVHYDIPLDVTDPLHDNVDLDFALIRIEEPTNGDIEKHNRQLSKLNILSDTFPAEQSTLINCHINIFSYFYGSKKCSIRDNRCISREDSDIVDQNYLWYKGDTSGGSSGAPLFNDQCQIVGIHKGSWLHGEDPANVGVLINPILEDMYGTKFGSNSPFEIKMRKYRDAGKDLGYPFASARKKLRGKKAV